MKIKKRQTDFAFDRSHMRELQSNPCFRGDEVGEENNTLLYGNDVEVLT